MLKYYLLLFILFIPGITKASEYYFQALPTEVSSGEQFEVILKLNTEGEKVNALSGRINYDPTIVDLERISDGGSLIKLWIDRPLSREVGVVDFSGITPGGFSSVDQPVVTLYFKAKASGRSLISLEDAKALLHDGLGTESEVVVRGLEVAISTQTSNVPDIVLPADNYPPENFSPVITSQPEVFSGDKVLIFSTVDQGSGLASYYVREYRIPFLSFLSDWQKVESPYRLQDQERRSYIEVKAVDHSGNERIVEILPEVPVDLYWYWLIPLLLLLAMYRLRNTFSHLRLN